jgi:hypothetical protein
MKPTRRAWFAGPLTVLLAASLLWYFLRWHNHWKRPLFHNTYATYENGIGSRFGLWYWQYFPTVVFDGKGGVLLPDFKSNMVAIVQYAPSYDKTVVSPRKINEDVFTLYVGGPVPVPIRREPNTLVAVDSSGIVFRAPLEPGAATQIFNKVLQFRDRGTHRFVAAESLSIRLSEYAEKWRPGGERKQTMTTSSAGE